jgi:hypothetical protein
MFESLNKYWNEYGLEILAVFSGIIIIVLYLYNVITNKRGSYSDQVYRPGQFGPPPKDSFYNYREHTIRDSKLELLVKYHIENIFNSPFYKIRPNFLKNEATGRNLEIDLFNKELGLGIEIQGIQHYKFSPRFHLSQQQFIEQQQRDQMKLHKCRQFGITIIEVPYHIKEKEVRNYLITQLKMHKFL